MDNPQIQYAKTSDGVSIAYWTLGDGVGVPLVHLSFPGASHIELEWHFPELHDWYVRLAKARTLVRFDNRGSGLSDREVHAWPLDALVRDIESVVDHIGIERFAVLGSMHLGPVAVAYAARHPERVSHLVLWCSWARPSDYYGSPEAETLVSLRDQDWDTYAHAVGHAFTGWSGGDVGNRLASLFQQSTTQETLIRLVAEASQWDVTSLLGDVRASTLVLFARDFRLVDARMGRSLASGISGARLAIIEGRSVIPASQDADALELAINEFLGDSAVVPEPAPPSGTAVILFADIVDSTALTERLGDDAFREKARGLDEAMRAAIRENGGTPVEGKTLGDGVLAVFTSAKQAIACAQACHEAASAAGLSLHAGIHAGDVIRESDNVYGGAVNIAARVAAASAAGETLVSGTVRDLARTSAGVSFEDRGEQALKGIDDPVRVWAVRGGA
jgi:class 3 adenylate cyclase/pimeloyl-ACP methyl ester carboxylesterase